MTTNDCGDKFVIYDVIGKTPICILLFIDMFIWSYCAQSNTFNNIIMVNFRDI